MHKKDFFSLIYAVILSILILLVILMYTLLEILLHSKYSLTHIEIIIMFADS